MAKSRIHRQFFKTLVHGFQTQLTIPENFFSKYVNKGRSVVELKSNESDKTWKVNLTGQSFTDGWEEFAVTHDFQIGDLVVVRYVRDMVFEVSDLGPHNEGKKVSKKRLHSRTQVDFSSYDEVVDDVEEDNIELPRKKKAKNIQEIEAETVSSSSEASKREFVATKVLPYASYSPCHKRLVTFTLPPDYVKLEKLCLPRPFLRENGIKPGEMYLLDKDGTKWLTKLIQDNRGTMKMRKGWKEFVKAIDLTSFTLKLLWEDTTPVLSFCDIDQDEFSEAMENNKEEKQFVTLTITPSGVKKCRLVLPAQFARKNGINKLGTIYLLDRDGSTKWLTNLQQDKKGTVTLGKGWKEFAEANDLKSGQSFTMELVWEDETPMLSLLSTKSNISKANEEESQIENRFVTLVLTPEDVKACKLSLPSQFMEANGINKLGKISLFDESRVECSGYLLTRGGTVALGNGWKGFCEANGVKLGESFTLEFINEQDTTPILKFSSQETS